jgi:ferric-dicitrate binding protein FerR (iron transport regulator)
MSAIPVSIPRAQGWRRTNRSVDHVALPARSTQPYAIVRAPNRQPAWRLTDRGIAVVMVIAAMILTAALIVIGLTVVRVTEPDYRTGFEEWTQAQK